MSAHGLHPVTGRLPKEWRDSPCVPVAMAAVTGCPLPEVLAALVTSPVPPPTEVIPGAMAGLAVELEDLTRWAGGKSLGGVIGSNRRPARAPLGETWWLGTRSAPSDVDREVARRLGQYGARNWRGGGPLVGISVRGRLAWGDRLPGGRYLLQFPTPWEDDDPEVSTGHVVALGVEAGRPRDPKYVGVWTVADTTWTPFPVTCLEDLGATRPARVGALWRVLP